MTAHIAGGGGNLEALDLLHRFGFDVNGIPGGVPPLVHTMQRTDDPPVRAGCSSTAPTRTWPGGRRVKRRCMSRDQVHAIVADAKEMLAAHPGIHHDFFAFNFDTYSDFSLKLFLYAFTVSTDCND